MFKFPTTPVDTIPVNASFKRKKVYTVMDKRLVYNMLFDTQRLEPKIMELQYIKT